MPGIEEEKAFGNEEGKIEPAKTKYNGDRNLTPKDVFTLFYTVFIDKERGPRLSIVFSHTSMVLEE